MCENKWSRRRLERPGTRPDLARRSDVQDRIALTRGAYALIDPSDYEFLSQWSWCASPCHGSRGRLVAVRGMLIAGRHVTIYMHREIMGLTFKDGWEVDHLNHNPLDNRRANLRVVTPTANKRRQPSREGSSSRFVGVTWDKTRNRWRAQIQLEGVVTNLGRYATEEEAAAARDAYVLKYDTGHKLNLREAA